VGDLLATLKAPFLVLADDQSPERNAYSGRVYEKGCPTLSAAQWKHVGNIVADAEKVAQEFGLDLVFHPHVATYVETPEECERFMMRRRIQRSGFAWTRGTACMATEIR